MSRLGRDRLALVCVLISWAGSSPGLHAAQRFQRGDSNADGAFNISDPVSTLGFLFLGAPVVLPCTDAADSDDDGTLNITDAVHSLGYLFLGSSAPPAPFGECGEDPTPEDHGCDAFEPCPGPPAPPFLDPPPSPTREGSIELRGTAEAGLLVRITGGLSATPVLATAGPNGSFAIPVEFTPNRLNRLVAVAEEEEGRSSAPAAVEVIQDSEPPFVYIDEPAGGSTVMTDKVTVTGRVSDMLSGFLGLEVLVNGEPVRIAIGIGTNGTFERADVPPSLGANTIRVVARDMAGNTSERDVTVIREEIPAGADRLEAVSGTGQAGPIHTMLPGPIIARASGANGSLLEGRMQG